MKKKYIYVCLITLCMCVAVLLVVFAKDNGIVTVTEKWTLTEHINDNNVFLQGEMETAETPYGYNIGIIEDEEVGKAFLIMPQTNISIQRIVVSENTKLYISSMLHPWVSKQSDGAILHVQIYTKNGTYEYDYQISENKQAFIVDLNDFANEIMDIQVNIKNENGYNENCDWVIFNDFFLSNEEESLMEQTFFSEGYVRSATYFADEWPLNFWNSELDHLHEDFKQIRQDGFDSIILVIPWREFQPNINPVTYNNYAFEQLDKIMIAAAEEDLEVYARLGYTWDYYNDDNDDIMKRYIDLLGDVETRTAWELYLEKMYTKLSSYDNFKEGFLTWEDYWGIFSVCSLEDENERLQKAEYLGFQDWVAMNYSLEEYNELYGTNYSSYEEILIPLKTEPSMRAMYEFFDNFLYELLIESQKKFDNLSLEVRMDWDVVYALDGTMEYYKHDMTFACGDSSYTATIYGIPMGFENKGEKVSYEEAKEKTNYILDRLRNSNGNKPIYIEQFLFVDNTPAFSYNAQIREDEINDYLKSISDVLVDYSDGYGIWTYRNYCSNMIYNSGFALEDTEWSHDDNSVFYYDEQEETSVCLLLENGYIHQEISDSRLKFPDDSYTVTFDVLKVNIPGRILIMVGGVEKELEITDTGKMEIEIMGNSDFNITIQSEQGEFLIDNIKLYSHVQQGLLYDENNEELECIDGIRVLNEELEQKYN